MLWQRNAGLCPAQVPTSQELILSHLGILGECSSKKNSMTLTIHIKRPEHPELLLHVPPSTMEAANPQRKGKPREGDGCCSAQRQSPPISSSLLWHYPTCGTLRLYPSLHTPLQNFSSKQTNVVSHRVCLRGSTARGGGATAPDGSVQCKQAWKAAGRGAAMLRPAQGAAMPSHSHREAVLWSAGHRNTITPQQTGLPTGAAISALRSLVPA